MEGLSVRRAINNRNGNVAVMFAIIAPALLAFAGAALDAAGAFAKRSSLQELADTLAVRGAREFLVANAQAARIESYVENLAMRELAPSFGVSLKSVSVEADLQASTVSVRVTAATAPSFLQNAPRDVTAASQAEAYGGANLCVIALEDREGGAISARMNARLEAPNCVLHANSTSNAALHATGSSLLEASQICSGGGEDGSSTNFSPAPTLDCPPKSDPLNERPTPPVGGCDQRDAEYGQANIETGLAAATESVLELFGSSSAGSILKHTKYTLRPGVYCGGLRIQSDADVTLEPGVYVIKDGPLYVGLGARMQGDGVAFYLEGDDATFKFDADSKISLAAPETGLMAGVLFFEDRTAPLGRTHSILSDDARRLLGTFYLPRGDLFVSSLKPIADQSAYTAIVARRLRMLGSPTLVLNTDYSLKTVPTPDGVGPVGGGVRLRD
ncbi:MAG: pilus assembly protein TadG-related protein [Pseudomonadota bacterium]